MTLRTLGPARKRAPAALAALLIAIPGAAGAQSLLGSPASLDRQNDAARMHDFTYIDTRARLQGFVEQGRLVSVKPDRDLALHQVSFPWARPEVALFVERLAGQYRSACGEQLVVTSLTRPTSHQPRNASDRSVHPTGMAVDLRYPQNRACRSWLEGVLLELEGAGVLEATRERNPPHYHVAVFPRSYLAHVDAMERRVTTQVAAATTMTRASYRVRSGDSLWTIARRHGTTVDEIRALNDLRGSRIFAGQVLDVPSAR